MCHKSAPLYIQVTALKQHNLTRRDDSRQHLACYFSSIRRQSLPGRTNEHVQLRTPNFDASQHTAIDLTRKNVAGPTNVTEYNPFDSGSGLQYLWPVVDNPDLLYVTDPVEPDKFAVLNGSDIIAEYSFPCIDGCPGVLAIAPLGEIVYYTHALSMSTNFRVARITPPSLRTYCPMLHC